MPVLTGSIVTFIIRRYEVKRPALMLWSPLVFFENWTHICVHSGFMLERNFVFTCLHLPKFFFIELLVYPVTVICLGIPEMQVSHI